MPPLWSGRFNGDPSELMVAFSESLTEDMALVDEDIAGSVAHATMLGDVGLISGEEARALVAGLERVGEELRSGRWRPGPEHEDIHMAVEARLAELVSADLAGRLHTARSRNDQVATDVRLWLRRHLDRLDGELRRLIQTLLDRCERDGRTPIPGYTHLQRGQPIWLAHHLLAYAWMLRRDRDRLADARRRADASPLGACAMAGTPLPVDRRRTAELLGFSAVIPNAMDAVAARDHLQEVAGACAIVMVHLSRMAEELVLWSSSEFDLVRLPDALATGSSIMPNKRNPDSAELVRGKAARVIADAQALLVMAKGLPLAYNRDLQEDKRPLFDALLTTVDAVRVTAAMWRDLTIRRDRFTDELAGDPSLATELADHLVTRGVPFREAHGVAGRLVRWCEERGVGLDALTLEVLREHHDAFGDDALDALDPRAAIEGRTSEGGTAWREIERQVARLRDGS